MDRSEAKREYKEAKQAMGVFRIRNTRDQKSYLGSSKDLRAILNRHRTELRFGSHRNKELLGEWRSLGEAAFEFEVLDQLEHDKETRTDPEEDLQVLAEMWVGKLEQAGESVVRL